MLAGSASMIGAMRLAALAGRLDGLAAREEFPELLASLDELTAMIRATRDAVEHTKADLEAAHI
jgi:HPt (histidine-containing phosphotransfer) domain-containing protein